MDTPGYGDARNGPTKDAKVISTIATHFQRKGYFPNFIILTISMQEVRLAGEFSRFVQMLKLMKKFYTDSVLDTRHPNLVVVLTHLCGVPPELQRDPTPKIALVRQIVADYLGLANVPVEVAENDLKGYANHLPKKGDYYRLPNKTLFPKNIYQSLEQVASRSNDDKMGLWIVAEAYKKLKEYRTTIPNFKIEETSHAIERMEDWRAIFEEIKSFNPDDDDDDDRNHFKILNPDLTRKLVNMGYQNLQSIPRHSHVEKMKFFRQLRPNFDEEKMLWDDLRVCPPDFSTLLDISIGRTFNVVKNFCGGKTIVDLGCPKLVPEVGFQVAENLRAHLDSRHQWRFEICNSAQEVAQKRLKQFGLKLFSPDNPTATSNTNGGRFQFASSPSGYNILSVDDKQLTILYEFRNYKFQCNDWSASSIRPEFQKEVNKLPTLYDSSDPKAVNRWKLFFETYGTHVISSCHLGGSIVFKISHHQLSEKELSDLATFASFGITHALASFISKFSSSQSTHCVGGGGQSFMQIEVKGGKVAEAYKLLGSPEQDFINCLTSWENSVMDDPVVLEDSILLTDLADVVTHFNPNVVNAMRHASADLGGFISDNGDEDQAVTTREKDSDNTRMLIGTSFAVGAAVAAAAFMKYSPSESGKLVQDLAQSVPFSPICTLPNPPLIRDAGMAAGAVVGAMAGIDYMTPDQWTAVGGTLGSVMSGMAGLMRSYNPRI